MDLEETSKFLNLPAIFPWSNLCHQRIRLTWKRHPRAEITKRSHPLLLASSRAPTGSPCTFSSRRLQKWLCWVSSRNTYSSAKLTLSRYTPVLPPSRIHLFAHSCQQHLYLLCSGSNTLGSKFHDFISTGPFEWESRCVLWRVHHQWKVGGDCSPLHWAWW